MPSLPPVISAFNSTVAGRARDRREIARLGRTLRRWRDAFLAYFTTSRSSNGGTEAVNGIIELHRRLARGYRNRHNYRLRMLLAAGGLTP